jgi:hypothetical protein
MSETASRSKGPTILIVIVILAMAAFAAYEYRARVLHAEVARSFAERLEQDVKARDDTIKKLLTESEAPKACEGEYKAGVKAGSPIPSVVWKDDKKVYVLTNEAGQPEEGIWDSRTMRIVMDSGAAVWFGGEHGTLAIYRRLDGTVPFWWQK